MLLKVCITRRADMSTEIIVLLRSDDTNSGGLITVPLPGLSLYLHQRLVVLPDTGASP